MGRDGGLGDKGRVAHSQASYAHAALFPQPSLMGRRAAGAQAVWPEP